MILVPTELRTELPREFIRQLQRLDPESSDELRLAVEAASEDVADGPRDIGTRLEEVLQKTLPDSAAWLAEKSSEELDMMLGLKASIIPGMVRWTSPDRDFNSFADHSARDKWHAAVEESEQQLANNEPTTLRRFRLLRHQEAGVVQMMIWLLEGSSGLLLDDVGLGKTIMALSLCAAGTYFAEYFDEHNEFPGYFLKSILMLCPGIH